MSSLMTAKWEAFEGYTSLNPCGCKARLLEVHSKVCKVTQICTSRENYGFQRYQSLDRGCWFSWSAWFSLGVLNTRIIPSWDSEITSCIHKEKKKENFRICKFPRWNHDRKTVSDFYLILNKSKSGPWVVRVTTSPLCVNTWPKQMARELQARGLSIWKTFTCNWFHKFLKIGCRILAEKAGLQLQPVLNWYRLSLILFRYIQWGYYHFLIPVGYGNLRIFLFLIPFKFIYHPRTHICKWNYPSNDMVFRWCWPK
jgi:hypothetical protein